MELSHTEIAPVTLARRAPPLKPGARLRQPAAVFMDLPPFVTLTCVCVRHALGPRFTCSLCQGTPWTSHLFET